MNWGHDQLANDLAAHLRNVGDRIAWTNMQLGPAGSPRPDVYTIPKSYAKFRPLAYEVKISVADFRRDITAGKWQSYLKFASGVIFAVPAGLIRKEEVPAGCGLIARNDSGWHNLKGPTLAKIDTLPQEAWLKLLIDGIGREVTRTEQSVRTANDYLVEKEIRKKYGDKIGQAFHDMARAQVYFEMEAAKLRVSTKELEEAERERTKQARKHVEQELAHMRQSQSAFAVALGLPADADGYEIASAAREARQRLVGNGEIERLREKLRHARRYLDDGLEDLPTVDPDAFQAEELL
ncbi:MAG: MmcB family DNA repair protein [Herbaspirillum huttiense]|uniref:MmcB family DNA repair protein n=1 Tax=Herbaspirillum huttiense TaxID=863372 RepID=UPI001AC8F68B|nr:MmcB family DNA repair protein [Herbaspirillum huttiense]MBN9356218.1 MmcB family DNA repair protein [Herbaspirillum huttiense]